MVCSKSGPFLGRLFLGFVRVPLWEWPNRVSTNRLAIAMACEYQIGDAGRWHCHAEKPVGEEEEEEEESGVCMEIEREKM